ncbi:hypothetical protein HMPREF3039_01312 [Akkermansia sp. KLE1798]|nr:hypothetical protein HMPREF3039_01312 [Akkermansia sp. KLE1798]
MQISAADWHEESGWWFLLQEEGYEADCGTNGGYGAVCVSGTVFLGVIGVGRRGWMAGLTVLFFVLCLWKDPGGNRVFLPGPEEGE